MAQKVFLHKLKLRTHLIDDYDGLGLGVLYQRGVVKVSRKRGIEFLIVHPADCIAAVHGSILPLIRCWPSGIVCILWHRARLHNTSIPPYQPPR